MMAWDVAGDLPRKLYRLAKHEGAVNAVAFVPGGSLAMAAGDDGSVWLWDLATGALVHRFQGHDGKINALAVSADGRFAVSSSWDHTARVWNIARRTPGPVLRGHKGPVNAAQFSADGAKIYSASYDGTIATWNRESGQLVRPIYKHGWGINVLVRLPGSEMLAFGALDGAAGIVDASSGTVIRPLPPHRRPVLALAANDRPGLIATAGGDGVIRVMRAGDGAVIEEFLNPAGPVWALAFAASGTALYFGGLDDFAARWQVAPRKQFEAAQAKLPRRFEVGDGLSQGERQFARKCSVCHTLSPDGANRAGPTLYGVFGRRIGTLPGYPYSDALKRLDTVWNEVTIGKLFELGPEHFTPGSKMPLQKITDKSTRDSLIAFLKAATGPGKGAVSPPAGVLDRDSGKGQPSNSGGVHK